MRELKFARRRDPAEETEAAEALQWLVQQPVLTDLPDFSRAVCSKNGLRCILSLSKAQRGLASVGLMQLVQAAYAAVTAVAQQPGQRPDWQARFWAWRVREAASEIKA
jgi:hypothetical protein